MEFLKNINWRSLGLGLGGLLITIVGGQIEDIKRKDEVRALVQEEIARIAMKDE